LRSTQKERSSRTSLMLPCSDLSTLQIS